MKPLTDWTLREMKNFCTGRGCGECLMYENYCRFRNCPCSWNLGERPKYTADEVTLAELLMKFGVETVRREENEDLLLDWNDCRTRLPAAAFPSVLPGHTVELEDIAESEVRNG